MPMTQQQAAQVLRRNAPAGEFPAFINPQEAKVLKSMGGAGKKSKSGLRSYFLQGLVGGGGQGTQTSTSTVELDPEVKKMRDKTFGMAEDVVAQPYQKFEGKRFADPSKDTLQAHDQVRDMQGRGQGQYTKAAGVGGDVSGYQARGTDRQSFLQGPKIQDYMGDQTTAVMDAMGRRGRQNIRQSLNELGAGENRALGGSFGSRGELMKGTAIAEGNQAIMDAQTQYLDKAFADAAARKQADMQMEATRQTTDADRDLSAQDVKLRGANTMIGATDAGRRAGIEDTNLLSKVGSDIEGREQNQLDFDYDEFVGERDHLKNQTSWLSNITAAAPGGQTGTSTSPYSSGNPMSEAFGAGLSAYGATGNPYVAAAGAGLSLLG